MHHRVARITLSILTGFLSITGAWGALLVIPELPLGMLRRGPFTDFTVPALALGLVAALSAVATYGLIQRRAYGPLLAVFSGVAIILFELVEAVAIGSLLDAPPGMASAGYVGLWLQPFYIVVGAAMIVLGRLVGGRRARVLA